MVTEEARYRDVRRDSWKRWFETAEEYDAYLAGCDPAKAAKWTALAMRIPPLDAERSSRLTGHVGARLRVLLASGVWCGDCVRQGPMIRQIARLCGDAVELRVIDRDRDLGLRDELRILGAMRVPVVVFLSEDYFEAGRFGDRTLTTYRRKVATETGAACAVPTAELPVDELARERDEWIDVFERMLLMVRLAPGAEARR
jgi:Thioredoxin